MVKKFNRKARMKAEEKERLEIFEDNLRKLDDLVERAEAGDREALHILKYRGWNDFVSQRSVKSRNSSLVSRYRKLLDDYANKVNYREWSPKIKKSYGRYRSGQVPDELIAQLTELIRTIGKCQNGVVQRKILSEIGCTRNELMDELNLLIGIEFLELCVLARNDVDAFEQLWSLMKATGAKGSDGFDLYKGVSFKYLGVLDLDRPAGWDSMVAIYVPHPYLGDFENPYPVDLERRVYSDRTGATSLRARRAIRLGDLTEAKRVFAICNTYADRRKEVGSKIWDDLTRMIDAWNRDLGLMPDPDPAEAQA